MSEYGTEWNFFVTLCCVWLIADFVHKYLFTSRPDTSLGRWQLPVLCFALMGFHQYNLTFGGLTEYILHANRTSSFFAANREGILSLFGYVPIYLLSEWFSARYFFSNSSNDVTTTTTCSDSKEMNSKSIQKHKVMMRILRQILIASTACGIGWYVSAVILQPTSRRLCNMPFTFMILCLASLMLAALLVVDTIGDFLWRSKLARCKSKELVRLPSTTMEIMSKHQLVVFMIANLLTGAVNMSMKTLYVPDDRAFLIICAYIFTVVFFSWKFDERFYAKK